ncbi:MAG: hypothetical protein QXT76_04900 [Sulfolobales archaeon]
MSKLAIHDTDILSEKLIDVVIRVAVGFKVRNFKLKATSSSFEEAVSKAIEYSSKHIVRVINKQFYCNLCGKGPYTRKGMYLHLLRMHKYEIKNMVREELKEIESTINSN